MQMDDALPSCCRFSCRQNWIGGGERRDADSGIRRDRQSGLRTGCDLRRALATSAEFGRRRAREGARWLGSRR